jgi:hypothetical protein
VALPVPRPYGRRKVAKSAVDASLPEAVAAFVEWLLKESGWRVSERDSGGELVDLRARHVCLLFRRFRSFSNDVTRPYVQALENRHTPFVGGEARSFAKNRGDPQRGPGGGAP